MGDIKKSEQHGGTSGGATHPSGSDDESYHADNPKTRGKDRDLDRSGTSRNQGHGHPREERGHQSDGGNS